MKKYVLFEVEGKRCVAFYKKGFSEELPAVIAELNKPPQHYTWDDAHNIILDVEKDALASIERLTFWFDNFYDYQIIQALRAERMGDEWSANDGSTEYTSREYLDAAAKRNQKAIRDYRNLLAENEKKGV